MSDDSNTTTRRMSEETRAAVEQIDALIGNNDTWAATHLPVVRIAGVLRAQNDQNFLGMQSNFADIIETVDSTAQHFRELIEILDAVAARCRRYQAH